MKIMAKMDTKIFPEGIKEMTVEDNSVKYLREAYKIAKESPDLSNQVGCVIVEFWDDFSRYDIDQLIFTKKICSSILGSGCNTFPPQIKVTPELLNNREEKLFYIEHAERQAIYEVIRNGDYFHEDVILYGNWLTCSDCARAIALCGIKKVVGHKQRQEMTPLRWQKSVEKGLDFLSQMGVELEFYDGPISGCDDIIVNGKKWNPNLNNSYV
jgi:dCMP deaminase